MDNIKNFIFIRHGYSYSNLAEDKWYLLAKIKEEPHLTDYGIISSFITGEIISKNIDIKNADFYISPLIRTWETLKCIFPTCESAKIGPYLKESCIFAFEDDKARKYSVNYKRFIEDFMPKYNEIKNELFSNMETKTLNIDAEDYEDSVKNCKNGDLNNGFSVGCSKYTENGDLLKFMQTYNGDKNTVVVVCHGRLMKNLLNKNHINNNTVVKVMYDKLKNNVIKTETIFDGVISDPEEMNYRKTYDRVKYNIQFGKQVITNRKNKLFVINTVFIFIFLIIIFLEYCFRQAFVASSSRLA
jgi:broad specificity phosphatase PhoE